jgi:hypothetical protein
MTPPSLLRFLPFAVVVLASIHCGGEADGTPTPAPAPSGGTSTPTPGQTPSPNGGSSSSTEKAPAAPKETPPLVTIQNKSSATRWIVVDSQSTPVDFKVSDPPLQLNAYGSYWCGGPKDVHNDPFAHVVKVEPGQKADIYWRAISVTREGDCWQGKPLAPGSYATKACFYETDPGKIYVPGTTSKTATLTCVDTTLVITADGVLDL